MRNPAMIRHATRTCLVVESGVVPYGRALFTQERLVSLRQADRMPDLLWLLQHPPTYTVGRLAGQAHLCRSRAEYRRRGIAVFEADRGGSVTYHGPGQLVAYPILRLGARPDLHAYLRQLEQAVICCLARYGLPARRRPGLTGVWVGAQKIASIGVKVSRGVTKHGLAVNASCDLDYFRLIRPCGLAPAAITSMERLLGWAPPVSSLGRALALAFGKTFGLDLDFESEAQVYHEHFNLPTSGAAGLAEGPSLG